MVLVTVEEASRQLSHLMKEAARGEEIVITDQDTPSMRLMPLSRPKVKREAQSV